MKSKLIDIDALITQANELTALPQSTVRLAALVGAKADNASEVADVVAFDPALTFKLIRAANSAFASRSEPVTTVRDAVDRLGTAQVFALAVAASVRPHMQKKMGEYGFSDGEYWRHSVAAAVAAEVASSYCKVTVPAESFTAALLHDIGKLIMAQFLKPEILDLLKQARESGGLTPLEAETRVLQVHHGELGGIIAQHWEFPQQVVKGIIFHHQPELGLDPICDVTYMANIGAKQIQARTRGKELDLAPSDDCMERLGMSKEGFEALCIAGVERFEQVRTRYNVK
ncbi:MAG: HDOD domain-containing protein [Verrucomicrobia bacterium]|nr:HDOD domain-containing protein [Verrucomicrobiota bacterium]